MKARILGYILALTLLAACKSQPMQPTPYGPADPIQGMGYVDRPLGLNTHEIQVRTNRDTPPETIEAHFNRRAQELCPAGIEKQEAKHSKLVRHHDAQIPAGLYGAYIPHSRDELPLLTGTVTWKAPL